MYKFEIVKVYETQSNLNTSQHYDNFPLYKQNYSAGRDTQNNGYQ